MRLTSLDPVRVITLDNIHPRLAFNNFTLVVNGTFQCQS